jgi:hypothetical protein
MASTLRQTLSNGNKKFQNIVKDTKDNMYKGVEELVSPIADKVEKAWKGIKSAPPANQPDIPEKIINRK